MIVTGVLAETRLVVALNVTLEAGGMTVTVLGTGTTLGLLLDRSTTTLVDWVLDRLTVTWVTLPPITSDGFRETVREIEFLPVTLPLSKLGVSGAVLFPTVAAN